VPCPLDQLRYIREWGTEERDWVNLEFLKAPAVPDGFELIQRSGIVYIRAKGIVGLVPVRCSTEGCDRAHVRKRPAGILLTALGGGG
jgi:hypothetical protein